MMVSDLSVWPVHWDNCSHYACKVCNAKQSNNTCSVSLVACRFTCTDKAISDWKRNNKIIKCEHMAACSTNRMLPQICSQFLFLCASLNECIIWLIFSPVLSIVEPSINLSMKPTHCFSPPECASQLMYHNHAKQSHKVQLGFPSQCTCMYLIL